MLIYIYTNIYNDNPLHIYIDINTAELKLRQIQ